MEKISLQQKISEIVLSNTKVLFASLYNTLGAMCTPDVFKRVEETDRDVYSQENLESTLLNYLKDQSNFDENYRVSEMTKTTTWSFEILEPFPGVGEEWWNGSEPAGGVEEEPEIILFNSGESGLERKIGESTVDYSERIGRHRFLFDSEPIHPLWDPKEPPKIPEIKDFTENIKIAEKINATKTVLEFNDRLDEVLEAAIFGVCDLGEKVSKQSQSLDRVLAETKFAENKQITPPTWLKSVGLNDGNTPTGRRMTIHPKSIGKQNSKSKEKFQEI